MGLLCFQPHRPVTMVPGLGRVLQSPDGASLFSTTYTLDGITYYTVSLQSPDGASLFSTARIQGRGGADEAKLQSPDGASLFSTP